MNGVTPTADTRVNRRKRGSTIRWSLIAALAAFTLPSPAWSDLADWIQVGPDGGLVTSITTDPAQPGTLYAGTEGGVFKREGARSRWRRASHGLSDLSVRLLAAHPRQAGTILAATFDGLFRSDDHGEEWRAVGEGLEEPLTIAFDPIDPNRIYAGTNGAGVFASADGGDTWTSFGAGIDAGAVISALAVDPGDARILYAGRLLGFGGEGPAPAALFKSEDAGTTWRPVDSGLPDAFEVTALAVDPAEPSTVYAGITDTGVEGAAVYRSTDRGVTWTPTSLVNFSIDAFRFDPVSGDVYAVIFHSIWRSSDRGATWQQIGVPRRTSLYDLAVGPSLSGSLYAATSDGVYASTDWGQTWARWSDGLSSLRVDEVVLAPTVPPTIHVIESYRLHRTRDMGRTWLETDSGIYTLFVDPVVPETLYGLRYEGRVVKSEDGGALWTPIDEALPVLFRPAALAVGPRNGDTLYVGGYLMDGLSVFKSVDGGTRWQRSDAGLQMPRIERLTIDPTDPAVIYASAYDAPIFMSDDGGMTWSRIETGPNEQVNDLIVVPATPSLVYIATSSGIYRSSDHGMTWNVATAGIGAQYVGRLAFDRSSPTTLYAATFYEGVYRTDDGGRRWVPIGSGLEDLRVTALVADPSQSGRLFAGTDGAGLIVIDTTPARECAGDCDGDRQVTIDELIRAVSMALGATPLDCPSLDQDDNGRIAIDEVVRAVGAAVDGC